MINRTAILEHTTNALTSQYGAFLRKSDLAKVLSTSPESLQNTLREGREPNVVYLRENKLRFGRRVFFAARTVAEALILDQKEIQRILDGSGAHAVNGRAKLSAV